MSSEISTDFRCGTVALVGRPNVGKSTLLNALIGYRLSITSRRAQTTRHRILGIHTREAGQVLYVDTPGLHQQQPRALNRQMNRAARSALSDVDVVAMVVEAGRWTAADQYLYDEMLRSNRPRVLVANKIDLVKRKDVLLPWLDARGREQSFDRIFLVSATKRDALEELETHLVTMLPEGPAVYEEDEITDRPERFLAAEQIREQLLRHLGEEVPHSAAVEIEAFERDGQMRKIAAIIWVERPGQKAIIIGKAGAQLKVIGERARLSMEKLFGCRVYLKLWVKERSGWADDESALRQFGLSD